MNKRDKRLLGWIGEQMVVNKQELRTLLIHDHEGFGHTEGRSTPGKHAVRELVNRWGRGGLVKSLYQSARGSHIYLTHTGLKIAELPFTARRVHATNIANLDHHDAVNRIRLHLEGHFSTLKEDCYWISERHLMQEEQSIPRGERQRRPDGVLVSFHNGSRVESAIEVERTVKQPKRLHRIMQTYAYSPRYDFTFFYYRDDRVKRSLERALARIPLALPDFDTPLQRIQLKPFPFDD